MASVGMFIALVHRVTLLQVNHMLIFTGDQGRKVISTIYPSFKSQVTAGETDDIRGEVAPTLGPKASKVVRTQPRADLDKFERKSEFSECRTVQIDAKKAGSF